jgi:arylsulfatase A-like enzyme
MDFILKYFGVISEQSTGFSGYDSFIPKDAISLGVILKQNGYATSWFGKDHNTPSFQASQIGPFDQWPIGLGFVFPKKKRPKIFFEKNHLGPQNEQACY